MASESGKCDIREKRQPGKRLVSSFDRFGSCELGFSGKKYNSSDIDFFTQICSYLDFTFPIKIQPFVWLSAKICND